MSSEKKPSEAVLELRKTTESGKLKKDALKEILGSKIDKIKFEEVKTKLLGVLYMVCEFYKDDQLVSRGISVRSLLDGFNKKKGKNKAFGRAVKALLTETSTEPIREEVPFDLIDRSITIKDDNTYEEIEKLTPHMYSYKESGNKVFYQLNPFLPLQIVKESGVGFKSEYKPIRVGFKGVDES